MKQLKRNKQPLNESVIQCLLIAEYSHIPAFNKRNTKFAQLRSQQCAKTPRETSIQINQYCRPGACGAIQKGVESRLYLAGNATGESLKTYASTLVLSTVYLYTTVL